MVNILFEIIEEAKELSKKFYNGIIVKCLVAPYHSEQLLKTYFNEKIGYYGYIMPENNMSLNNQRYWLRELLESMEGSDVKEIHIITSSMHIIRDMLGECTRLLTETYDIVNPLEEGDEFNKTHGKTLAANFYEIETAYLNNEKYKKDEKQYHSIKLFEIIDIVNKDNPSEEELTNAIEVIEVLGDSFLKSSLKLQVDKHN
jgi:hypothetical protein